VSVPDAIRSHFLTWSPSTLGDMTEGQRRLVDLGSGVFTVSEVCRVLQPTMTPRKVHYWLDTGLLSAPVRWGSRGHPTLLSYRQLLEIRTVQHLRDELEFSLPKVREALEWILDHLFAEVWTDLHFAKGVDGSLVAQSGDEQMVVPGGQGVLEGTLPELNDRVAETRRAWEEQAFVVPDHKYVVSNARVLAGAPTIRGTRIDTAVIAGFSEADTYTQETLQEIGSIYPWLEREAIVDALEFEGISPAA
jgi:uncharacterized protein (DUF433 family)/DNA-binding transcriptional MerR regulator